MISNFLFVGLAAGLFCIGGWCWQMLTAANSMVVPTGSLTTELVTLDIKKMRRRYLVHLPESYNETLQWPVVIMFHGGGGTAKSAISTTEWTTKADKEGFIAVFPEGTSPNPSLPGRFIGNPQSWNDGSKRPTIRAAENGVNDIAYVSAMIDDLKKRYHVNHRQIYSTGFSNGASMSFRVGRELSSKIAAIAPVAGHDWIDNKPDRPVPLIFIVGAVDPLCPIEGGKVFIGKKSFGEKPKIRKMLSKWVRLHGGQEQSRQIFNKDQSKGEAFNRPGEFETVVLYIIGGHGHHWPGGKSLLGERFAGKNTSQLKATDVIWEFFKTHSLPEE